MDFIINMDSDILLYIQEHIRCDILDVFFSNFTRLGDGGVLWIIISLVCIIFKKTRKLGLMIALALLFGLIITNIVLKNVIARPRPFYNIQDLYVLIPYPKDYSFPSGHTTSSFAACTTLFIMLKKRYSFIFLIFATLMGFSRLYVGVHYPTDVLCGLIIGVLCAISSYYIIKWIYLKKSTDLQKTISS